MTVGYSSFNTPVGNVAPTLQNNRFAAVFNNTATFTTSDPGGSCAAGEYRQYVMGSFTVDGSPITHRLCGSTVMSPNVLQEDGCPSPNCTAYGYRACPPNANNRYTPTQATGAQFVMACMPGFTNIQPGHRYGIDLTFQGQLIDTTTHTTLASQTWTVAGSQIVPQSVSALEAGPLGASDKVVAALRLRNQISGLWEVHLVIARKPGQPPIAAAAVALRLLDAAGAAILAGQPKVHEIADHHRATASIVHPLAQDAAEPATARVTFGDEVLDLAITTP